MGLLGEHPRKEEHQRWGWWRFRWWQYWLAILAGRSGWRSSTCRCREGEACWEIVKLNARRQILLLTLLLLFFFEGGRTKAVTHVRAAITGDEVVVVTADEIYFAKRMYFSSVFWRLRRTQRRQHMEKTPANEFASALVQKETYTGEYWIGWQSVGRISSSFLYSSQFLFSVFFSVFALASCYIPCCRTDYVKLSNCLNFEWETSENSSSFHVSAHFTCWLPFLIYKN